MPSPFSSLASGSGATNSSRQPGRVSKVVIAFTALVVVVGYQITITLLRLVDRRNASRIPGESRLIE